MTKKQLIRQCDKIANLYLGYASEWKSLSRSLERTTDKEEIEKVKEFIKRRAEMFKDEMKGGIKE